MNKNKLTKLISGLLAGLILAESAAFASNGANANDVIQDVIQKRVANGGTVAGEDEKYKKSHLYTMAQEASDLVEKDIEKGDFASAIRHIQDIRRTVLFFAQQGIKAIIPYIMGIKNINYLQKPADFDVDRNIDWSKYLNTGDMHIVKMKKYADAEFQLHKSIDSEDFLESAKWHSIILGMRASEGRDPIMIQEYNKIKYNVIKHLEKTIITPNYTDKTALTVYQEHEIKIEVPFDRVIIIMMTDWIKVIEHYRIYRDLMITVLPAGLIHSYDVTHINMATTTIHGILLASSAGSKFCDLSLAEIKQIADTYRHPLLAPAGIHRSKLFASIILDSFLNNQHDIPKELKMELRISIRK